MITLGIETSCDETSCAVLENGFRIRSNVISSSLLRHRPFGGVVPEIASRHCLEQIDFVFRAALRKARVTRKDLDLISVTYGPGLAGSLLVGLSFAKALAYELKIPFVGVNHLEAHLSANFIGRPVPEGPFIGLIVSGGHTELTCHRKGSIEVLGSTVDDAVGECYDKVAKLLGFGYPGGPILDRLAQKGNSKAFRFTRPKQSGRFDFSFSGIKTAVLHLVKENVGVRSPRPLHRRFLLNLSASFQETVVRWLVEKSIDACRMKKAKDLVAGGGVSANSRLRALLTEEAALYKINVHFPPLSLVLDNGAMIARRGFEQFKQGRRSGWNLSARPGLRIGE
ncbi:MAG: tRNA (adenosine(37)-N6)-threonylcarbamoyltransferase complex transferase subunit TsaD [Candidatus Omnitrophica bacterium]|nr:tRNA (adenosine(37)-N6)-threonylcarbamoyltransferase complex transferase subunit TsaD [Candidatus Omnitrophota bacterium]